jgi:hypothetical protein
MMARRTPGRAGLFTAKAQNGAASRRIFHREERQEREVEGKKHLKAA